MGSQIKGCPLWECLGVLPTNAHRSEACRAYTCLLRRESYTLFEKLIVLFLRHKLRTTPLPHLSYQLWKNQRLHLPPFLILKPPFFASCWTFLIINDHINHTSSFTLSSTYHMWVLFILYLGDVETNSVTRLRNDGLLSVTHTTAIIILIPTWLLPNVSVSRTWYNKARDLGLAMCIWGNTLSPLFVFGDPDPKQLQPAVMTLNERWPKPKDGPKEFINCFTLDVKVSGLEYLQASSI